MSDEKKDLIALQENSSKLSNIADEILNETDLTKIKALQHLFKVNATKRETLRIIKLQELLDNVEDKLIERVSEHPEYLNTDEWIKLQQITQNSLDRSYKMITDINNQPGVEMPTTVNLTYVDAGGDKDSRERIQKAVLSMLTKAKDEKKEEIIIEDPVISNTEEVISSEIKLRDDEE